MAKSRRGWYWHLADASLLAMGGALARVVVLSPIASSSDYALGQITPDATLGAESSVVTPQAPGSRVDVISGGATRGANLFHSFEQFSVLTGRTAFFSNAASIQNIISRVSGGSISNIDGLLRTNATANLFLINPNGIIFGPNAKLDIGGSFVGSTASRLLFSDGTEFSATNTQTKPLLTINAPIGLGFRDNTGNIVNRSQAPDRTGQFFEGFQVYPGKNLALIGGDVNIEGGLIVASGGRIELGGLSAAGTVKLNSDSSLSFPEGVARGNVSLNNALVDVSGGSEGRGSLSINAKNLELKEVSVLSAGILSSSIGGGLTSPDAQAGDVLINATEKVTLDGFSRIFNSISLGDIGEPGDIEITTKSLSLTNGSQVIASTFGGANAGIVKIKATDISADGVDNVGNKSGIFSKVENDAIGNSGGIDITTGSLTLTNAAQVNASTFGQGNAGKVTILASGNISLDGIGITGIFSSVEPGAIGNSSGIDITAANLSLTNGSQVDSSTFARGNAGGIEITTKNLSVTNGGYLSASTFGEGDAENVKINASDSISIDGSQDDSFTGIASQVGSTVKGNAGGIDITTKNLSVTNAGTLSVDTFGEGNAGDITINTGSLTIKNTKISASTNGKGNAGNLTVRASNSVELSGEIPVQGQEGSPGGLLSQADLQGEGKGGNITIETSRLSISDGSKVQVATFDKGGNAGNILIIAAEIDLFDSPNANNSFSTSISGGAIRDIRTPEVAPRGNGGNVTINTERLNVRNGAQVTVSTQGFGDAGNLNINASNSVRISGERNGRISGIFSESTPVATGKGGSLNIQTGNLNISDHAQISVSALGKSETAGNLDINADSLQFDRGNITATTRLGEGGNINLNIDDTLVMRNNSHISAQALNNANGGNITINAPDGFVVAIPNQNNDIVANAALGKGGNINITAESIFGIKERPLNPVTSDINASSEFGLQGNISINNPDVDPSQGLVVLPAELVDVSNSFATGCPAGEGPTASQFIITGRGGLPPNPDQLLTSDNVLTDWATLNSDIENLSGAAPSTNSTKKSTITQIVEANGWMINNKGEVVLIATVPTNTLDIPWVPSSGCNASEPKS